MTAIVLLVPLVANQLTEGEGWSLGDFVFAAVLLVGTGALLELAASKPRSIASGLPPPRSASPPSCSGRPMTRPASCSSAACSSSARSR